MLTCCSICRRTLRELLSESLNILNSPERALTRSFDWCRGPGCLPELFAFEVDQNVLQLCFARMALMCPGSVFGLMRAFGTFQAGSFACTMLYDVYGVGSRQNSGHGTVFCIPYTSM